ncbi:hypothetical protein ACFFRR_010241 [Megaselia abdita]
MEVSESVKNVKQSQKKSQKPSVHKTHDLIKNCDIYVIINEDEKLLRYWMETDETAMSEMKVHYMQESALYYFIIMIFLCVKKEKNIRPTPTLHASYNSSCVNNLHQSRGPQEGKITPRRKNSIIIV